MSERPERFGTDDYLLEEVTVKPQELRFGIVRDAPSPTPRHQDAVLNFAFAWRLHTIRRSAGHVIIAPMDCVLDRERALIVQPDLLFVSRERGHIITDRVWGAPDLVLEVLSPHPRIGTLEERIHWFAQYGVKECWLYHQAERTLEILSFDAGAERGRCTLEFYQPIVSRLWPEFDLCCAEIVKPLFPIEE